MYSKIHTYTLTHRYATLIGLTLTRELLYMCTEDYIMVDFITAIKIDWSQYTVLVKANKFQWS